MARRTRRPRVVWLPQDPFFSVDAATTDGSTIMHISDALITNDAGDSVTVVAPVVRDTSPNPLTPANTLSDIQNSGYRLRRIVGKIWVSLTPGQLNNQKTGAVVTSAGFIILRTDPSAGTPQNPVGAAYDVNQILNTDAPWIWRRSWLLADNSSLNSAGFGDTGTQIMAAGWGRMNNYSQGGNSDGPHVDQKTARVVGPDERLFLVFTSTALTGAAEQAATPLDYVYDLRVLASMRTNVGNRGNSSR